jgi:hypothetical protein
MPTVKANILKMLGIFCEYFPETMKPRSKTLLQLYLESLAAQFKAQKSDMQVRAIYAHNYLFLCVCDLHFNNFKT